MKYVKTLISSILGGVCIGIGAMAYLMSDLAFIGALIFAISFFVICSFRLNLFTGQISYVFQNGTSYSIALVIALIGNLFGAWIMAWLTKMSGIVGMGDRAIPLVHSQLNNGLWHLFISAILCGFMIYISVEGYRSIKSDLGKHIALFLGVIVFVMCGFEHSITDMSYFSLVGLSGRAIVCLLIILLGNAAGGVIAHNIYNLISEQSKPDGEYGGGTIEALQNFLNTEDINNGSVDSNWVSCDDDIGVGEGRD